MSRIDARVMLRVRETAIRRLVSMAEESKTYRAALLPVLVQALGDPNQSIRFLAFDSLKQLGLDTTTLASHALQCGRTDLGVAGLKLLTEKASAKQAGEILREAMLTREDHLAIEAAQLLIETDGVVKVAPAALEAAYPALRTRAVEWLSEEYDDDKKARSALRKSLESRFRHVRRAAASALATKKDKAAFETLVEQLQSQEKSHQKAAIGGLSWLNDPRATDALLDRLENDASGTAEMDHIFQVVRDYRRVENVDRLLAMMDDEKWRNGARHAVHAISGHDQPIEDPEDELPDKSWEEKQQPRHDDILARLLEKYLSLGMSIAIARSISGARWARTAAADSILATLAAHPDDIVRRETVQAIGWRLRKREGPADALLTALEHRDGITKFLAAEGLAKAGRSEGINVLLASIDLMSELPLRQRAVAALGELADERGLDVLLRLASDDGHALQDTAIEAIGHLGKSEKADEIFKLLAKMVDGHGSHVEYALRGLRWIDTHDGWQLVRQRASDPSFFFRPVALQQLGYNDDRATRDLLLNVLSKGEYSQVDDALTAARRIWGDDSLEPLYALLKNSDDYALQFVSDHERLLEKVCEAGEAEPLFEIVGSGTAAVRRALFIALLKRDPPPVDAALEALASNQPGAVRVAAHVLARGDDAKKHSKPIESALLHWRQEWDNWRQRVLKGGHYDEDQHLELTRCLYSLIWAAGRANVSSKLLIEALEAWPEDAAYEEIQPVVVQALGNGKSTKAVLDALQQAALTGDHSLRWQAASTMAAQDAKRISHIAEEMLSDRVSFNRLAAVDGEQVATALKAGVRHVHYQSVVLPQLIDRQDVETLAGVMRESKLPDATRLGAIEALAKTASEAAEKQLAEFGTDEKDEELRKAAWRARRQSIRARKKAKE